MQSGTKLVNKPEGTTGGVQTVSDDEDFTDKYAATARDVYVPGEYEERDHSGRSAAQIQVYRTNQAFLNRARPAALRPKRNMSVEEVRKWLPDVNNGRTPAQNACYIANRQRFAALKAQYEQQKMETEPPRIQSPEVDAQSESSNPIGKLTPFQKELMAKYKTFDMNDPFLIEMERLRQADIEADRILEEKMEKEAEMKRANQECHRRAMEIMAENERRVQREECDHDENPEPPARLLYDPEKVRQAAIEAEKVKNRQKLTKSPDRRANLQTFQNAKPESPQKSRTDESFTVELKSAGLSENQDSFADEEEESFTITQDTPMVRSELVDVTLKSPERHFENNEPTSVRSDAENSLHSRTSSVSSFNFGTLSKKNTTPNKPSPATPRRSRKLSVKELSENNRLSVKDIDAVFLEGSKLLDNLTP